MNVASIDIGSNTVLLLIAQINLIENDFKVLKNEYRIPRISKGLSQNNNINDYKINELMSVLEEYQSIISTYDCKYIVVKATNALRVASNSEYIIKHIKDKLNLSIEVISGEEEARLSYFGVTSYFKNQDELYVLDIGGGSTEIIKGNGNRLVFRKSFPFGAVNLTEKLIENYPVSITTQKKLNFEINDKLNDLNKIANSNTTLVAVAGTPISIACMLKGLSKYDETLIEGTVIERKELEGLSTHLGTMLPADILRKFGDIIKGREDVIYSGSVILLNVMDQLKQSKLFVSSRGLRYGSVIQLIKDLK